ncbi:MAG: hypothetical protein HY329_03510 [Chloroflexi bacterium]|nr:hypothetical protein [Chloroflexota bacterium]
MRHHIGARLRLGLYFVLVGVLVLSVAAPVVPVLHAQTPSPVPRIDLPVANSRAQGPKLRISLYLQITDLEQVRGFAATLAYCPAPPPASCNGFLALTENGGGYLLPGRCLDLRRTRRDPGRIQHASPPLPSGA